MPKFTIEHQTAKPVDETFGVVKKILSNESEIKKFDPKAKVQIDETRRSCQVTGGQFKAEMNVSENGSGSQVSVHVDIPFLLTPFKGKIQDTLQKMLGKHLG